MGKKSTKENKNMFQLSRERAGFTRDEASEIIQCMSADRIEKIENERISAHPEDVLLMSTHYKDPGLRNKYCSAICPLGSEYVAPIESKVLSQITLEMIASLNSLDQQKNRLIEITVDGHISEDEYHDFAVIKNQLDKITASVSSLKLWMEQMVYEGKLDAQKLKEIQNNL